MNKILLASVALLGLAGVAGAQEAPGFYGANPYAAHTDVTHGTAHAATIVSDQTGPSLTTDGFQINQNQNYAGR